MQLKNEKHNQQMQLILFLPRENSSSVHNADGMKYRLFDNRSSRLFQLPFSLDSLRQ